MNVPTAVAPDRPLGRRRSRVSNRAAAAAAVLLLGAALPALGDSCEDCHSDAKFFVQDKKLFTYYQDWLGSPHKAAGLTCDDCHGGDPKAPTKAGAHKGVLRVSDPESPVYYRNQPQTCGACHEQIAAAFAQSKHFKALLDDTDAPSCATCHRAMFKRTSFAKIAQRACATCHNPEGVTSVPLVVERADEILHRVNIIRTYLNWLTKHYADKGWPGYSRKTISRLRTDYKQIVLVLHRLDLAAADDASAGLLIELKAKFKEAWDKDQAGS